MKMLRDRKFHSHKCNSYRNSQVMFIIMRTGLAHLRRRLSKRWLWERRRGTRMDLLLKSPKPLRPCKVRQSLRAVWNLWSLKQCNGQCHSLSNPFSIRTRRSISLPKISSSSSSQSSKQSQKSNSQHWPLFLLKKPSKKWWRLHLS